MDYQNKRARVFISSGQALNEEQLNTQAIANYLREQEYEPYIARNEQVGNEVNESILQAIQDSEYFVIVNFKRFSVYVFQELAIARYLKKPLIALQQHGAEKPIEQEGMGRAMLLNPLEFMDSNDLLANFKMKLKEKEDRREWIKTHRDELSIETYSNTYDERTFAMQHPLFFYHLRVRNYSQFRHARGCAAFLVTAINLDTKAEVTRNIADLKWVGLALPAADIYRGGHDRIFAAVCVFPQQPTIGCMFPAVDNLSIPKGYINGPGEFLLTYSVLSENFPEVTCNAKLTLGTRIEEFTFSIVQ